MNDIHDDKLRELARDYHEPPRALSTERRDELWKRIEATRGGAQPDITPLVRPNRITRFLWPVAAAALLLLGIGIGQRSQRPAEQPLAVIETDTTESWSPTSTEAVYRLVAREFLQRTDAKLTEFRQAALSPTPGGGSAPPVQFGWAGDLLLHTRLLMDSPAADSPELERLLRDLELILAQIVQLTAESDPQERKAIRDNIEKRSLLWRVRDEIPADGPTRGA